MGGFLFPFLLDPEDLVVPFEATLIPDPDLECILAFSPPFPESESIPIPISGIVKNLVSSSDGNGNPPNPNRDLF